jgi:hypothetical protein
MTGNSWGYEFAARKNRNRAAGKASFLHPGLVFLRPGWEAASDQDAGEYVSKGAPVRHIRFAGQPNRSRI